MGLSLTFYRLSVLNVCAGIALLACIVFTIGNYSSLSAGEGWGVVAMLALMGMAVLGLLVDIILQRLIAKRFWVNVVGFLVAVGAFYLLGVS